MNLQGVEMLNLENQFCYTPKQKKHLVKNKKRKQNRESFQPEGGEKTNV